MIVNAENLTNLYRGFRAAFQQGIAQYQPQWSEVATRVPSSTRTEEYGWLSEMPSAREWVGDREINTMEAKTYTLTNKDYEASIKVDRNAIEDDQLGLTAPRFQRLGEVAAGVPDQLVFKALKEGFSTVCYDGQFFFDTDHPVKDATGATVTVSNTGGGSGDPWFLLDTSKSLKPLIYQERRPFQLVRLDNETDENVFMRRQYIYGTDGRCTAGYGYWQLAYGSKQALDATSYANARKAMMTVTGDGGRPLSIMPNLLVVHPNLEAAGRALLEAQMNASGASNIWFNTARLMIGKWL